MKAFDIYLLVTFFSVFLFHASTAQALQSIDKEKWALSERGVEIVEKDNQQVFKLTSGKLTLLDQLFDNGEIEFEMKTEGERAFVYAYFRENAQESEVVYLRTHKSNSPDALQYSPVFQGRSAWQIYHGEKGTALASFPNNEWFKVKLSVQNETLSMWVGDSQKPSFTNIALTGKKQTGSVSLRGFIPRGSPANYSTYIRNVSVVSQQGELVSKNMPEDHHHDFIDEISVSAVFEASKSPIKNIPASLLNKKWTTINAEKDGIFEFLRWREIPREVRSYAVVAETMLVAQSKQICQIDLGFSDAISVLVNGQIIGHADQSYRYAPNRQQGVLHNKQLSLFLPLVRGENKLHMIVADSFGGWGLKAKLVDCSLD